MAISVETAWMRHATFPISFHSRSLLRVLWLWNDFLVKCLSQGYFLPRRLGEPLCTPCIGLGTTSLLSAVCKPCRELLPKAESWHSTLPQSRVGTCDKSLSHERSTSYHRTHFAGRGLLDQESCTDRRFTFVCWKGGRVKRAWLKRLIAIFLQFWPIRFHLLAIFYMFVLHLLARMLGFRKIAVRR